MKALKCIYEELKGVAKVECEDPKNYIKKGLEALEKKIFQKSMEDTAVSKALF